MKEIETMNKIEIVGYINYGASGGVEYDQRSEIEKFVRKENVEMSHWLYELKKDYNKPLKDSRLFNYIDQIPEGSHVCIVVPEIFCLAKSTDRMCSLMKKCIEKQCALYAIKEDFVFRPDENSEALLYVFDMFVKIESSIMTGRARNRQRPQSLKLEQPKNLTLVTKMLNDGQSVAQIARQMQVSIPTVYRVMKNLNLRKGVI